MGTVDLTGRTALVTSSSRNLGRSICRALAEAGATVAVCYHSSEAEARELVEDLARSTGRPHHALRGDLENPQGAEDLAGRALEALGAVHVLVNNSGPFSMTPFTEMPLEEWQRVWDSNVTAAYALTHGFAPGMREAGWGRVVNIGAGSAYLRNHSIYGLSKAALSHLSESLALELGPQVTVNTVAPGQIEESAPDVSAIDPTFVDRALARTPAGRLVTRDEVADVVVALCGPTFDLLTGATLPLDGGWRLNRF